MNHGLLQSELTIGGENGLTSISLAGKYKCEFTFEDEDTLYSEGDLVIRLVTVSPLSTIVSYNSEELQITCTLKESANQSTSQVKWTHGNDLINSGTSNNNEDYILTLKNPTDLDNGQYICEFVYDDEHSPKGLFTSVTINNIEMSPEIIYSTYGDTVTLTLNCEVPSSEKVELIFVISEEEIPGTEANFTGDKTTLTHDIAVPADINDATYSCTRSGSNDAAKKNTTLKVVVMNVVLYPKTIGNKDTSKTLTCSTEWNRHLELPTIQWFKGDEEVQVGVVTTEGNTNVTSTLPVFISEKTHGDAYKCAVQYTGIVGGHYDSSTVLVMSSKLFTSLVQLVL